MKRIAFPILLTIIAFTLTFSSCKKDTWPCISGKGNAIAVQRAVDGFSRVESLMDAEVFITQGSEYSVALEAQNNLIEHIRTEVKNGELRIYNKRCIKKHDPVRVHITMPTVSGVVLAGSGSIRLVNRIESNALYVSLTGSGSIVSNDSVIADHLDTELSGSGDVALHGAFGAVSTGISGSGSVEVQGHGASHDVKISGSGDVNTFGLAVKTSNVNITGSGNARVNVSDNLTVDITGSGQVYFKGQPSVTTNITGSGAVVAVP